MTKRKKRGPDTGKVQYDPIELERDRLREQALQWEEEALAPKLKAPDERESAASSEHYPSQSFDLARLKEAFRSEDRHFINGLAQQLIHAASHLQGDALDFNISVIKGVKPNDQLEAMLAAQMAAIHLAMMKFSRQLSEVENIPQQDSAERALNKLARTFTMQMEALKRYRTGGEQKVTVQHVSVSEGGQAIVGNVTQGADKTALENPAEPTPALADARQPAMTIIGEPERAPVPLRRKRDVGSSA